MYQRKILPALEKHLDSKFITVLSGMRRVGKTTILKHLLNKWKDDNKAFFDLERVENRFIFSKPNYRDIEATLQSAGIDFNKRSLIALDEIQLVPSSTSVIKHLYDNYPVKFVVTGSSSFYLKNQFSESLAGRKRIFEIYPLSFDEYLIFKNVKVNAETRKPFDKFNIVWYNKLKKHYEEFVKFGGFPEVVLAGDKEEKTEYLKDIINAYIELDVKLLSDFNVSGELYKLIRLIAARTGSKTDFTKLSSLTGISRHKVRDYYQLLEHTYFIHTVAPFVKNTDREISSQQKFYFSDTGILNALTSGNENGMFENAIANQLRQLGKINYYARKTGQEIDFIFNGEAAVEVKQTANSSDAAILKKRAASINLKKCFLVGRKMPLHNYTNFVWGGNLF